MSLNNINHVCSIGPLCRSSKLIKTSKLKLESYPFDWIFSNLDMIQHCIKDNFKIFLDKQYYTRNINDKNKKTKQVHIYYYPNKTTMFNHRNPLINDHYDYYIRCVNRFKMLLGNKNNKLFIYFGSIDENKIIEFNNNLKKYTCNYRILVINSKVSNKHNYNFKTIDNIDYLFIETLSTAGGISYGNPKDNEYLKMIIHSKYKFQLQYLIPPDRKSNIPIIKNKSNISSIKDKSNMLKILLISNKSKNSTLQNKSINLQKKSLYSNKKNLPIKNNNTLLLLKNKRK